MGPKRTWVKFAAFWATLVMTATSACNDTISSVVSSFSPSMNEITQPWSIILGGRENQVFSSYASILGGSANVVSGPFTTVMGGHFNTASGRGATCLSSNRSVVSGNFAVLLSGSNSSARGDSTVVVGPNAHADHHHSAVLNFKAGLDGSAEPGVCESQGHGTVNVCVGDDTASGSESPLHSIFFNGASLRDLIDTAVREAINETMSNVLADVQALQDQVVAMTSGSSFAPIAPTTTDAQSDVSDVSDACTFEGGNAFECPTSFQDGSMQFTSVATIDVPIQEDWQSDMSFAATAIDTMCSVANDLGNNTDSSLECDEISSTVSIVDYATMSQNTSIIFRWISTVRVEIEAVIYGASSLADIVPPHGSEVFSILCASILDTAFDGKCSAEAKFVDDTQGGVDTVDDGVMATVVLHFIDSAPINTNYTALYEDFQLASFDATMAMHATLESFSVDAEHRILGSLDTHTRKGNLTTQASVTEHEWALDALTLLNISSSLVLLVAESESLPNYVADNAFTASYSSAVEDAMAQSSLPVSSFVWSAIAGLTTLAASPVSGGWTTTSRTTPGVNSPVAQVVLSSSEIATAVLVPLALCVLGAGIGFLIHKRMQEKRRLELLAIKRGGKPAQNKGSAISPTKVFPGGNGMQLQTIRPFPQINSKISRQPSIVPQERLQTLLRQSMTFGASTKVRAPGKRPAQFRASVNEIARKDHEESDTDDQPNGDGDQSIELRSSIVISDII